MRLIRSGQIDDDDVFAKVADDAALPSGPAIVSAARFLAERSAMLAHPAPLGVIWPNNRDVAELAADADWLALIALQFPTFRDGRAYSQARLLRERFGFRGELRATGQVLRDQFLFLVRAGFNAFEVSKDADAEHFAAALARYSVVYQPAGDNRVAAAQRRLGARLGVGAASR